jgi:hypothetical protein
LSATSPTAIVSEFNGVLTTCELVRGGLVIIAPVYFSILLLLKAMKAVAGLVRPLARLLPTWFPAEQVLSLLFVLTICFLIGAVFAQRQDERRGSELKNLFSKESRATHSFGA